MLNYQRVKSLEIPLLGNPMHLMKLEACFIGPTPSFKPFEETVRVSNPKQRKSILEVGNLTINPNVS